MATTILSASLEDYLEAIHHIVGEKQAARAKDIADRLHVKSSSVTSALRTLAEKELINYAPYDVITLTSKGKKVANNVVRRHEALCDFFVKILSVDRQDAEESACKMEHGISPMILERFIQFVEFMEKCPRMNIEWSESNGYHCKHGLPGVRCEKCIYECLDTINQQKQKSNKELQGSM